MKQHVIKVRAPKIIQPNSKRPFWIFLSLIIMALGIAFLAYRYGLEKGANGQFIVMGSDAEVNDQLNRLLKKNNELEAELTLLKTNEKINHVAVQTVKQKISEQQTRQLSLKKENALLNELVSSGKVADALQMMDFKLTATNNKHIFQYGLTLTHIKQNSSKPVEGRLHLILDGMQDNKKRRLEFKQISAKKKVNLKFKFDHFKRIEGQLRLPTHFKPKAIIVNVNSKNSRIKGIKARYNWNVQSN